MQPKENLPRRSATTSRGLDAGERLLAALAVLALAVSMISYAIFIEILRTVSTGRAQLPNVVFFTHDAPAKETAVRRGFIDYTDRFVELDLPREDPVKEGRMSGPARAVAPSTPCVATNQGLQDCRALAENAR